MKKLLLIVAIISFMVIVNVYCAKVSSTQTVFNDSAIMAPNSCVDILKNNLSYRVCLDSVSEDSRCPEGTQCIWQGIGACKFSISFNNQTYSVKLYTWANDYFKTDTTINGIRFQLKELMPYPKINGGYTYYDYKAKIVLY